MAGVALGAREGGGAAAQIVLTQVVLREGVGRKEDGVEGGGVMVMREGVGVAVQMVSVLDLSILALAHWNPVGHEEEKEGEEGRWDGIGWQRA